ncbi:unnamed protein product [Blepharisma stoltei]|uniref:Uncharacterized protein n=1 Tax=Blepharisma stoltei TaxID=1481888 RepID=A0AAU9K941_9CILI|nr:unnamed protein product [Blepharisma stoltei]
MMPSDSLSSENFIAECQEAINSHINRSSPLKELKKLQLIKLKPYIANTERLNRDNRYKSRNDNSISESQDNIRIHRKKDSTDSFRSSSVQLLFANTYSMKTIASSKLGPGHYHYDLNTFNGPSFHFSTIARFSNNLTQTLVPKLNFSDLDKNQEILNENKDMKKHLPSERIRHLRDKAKSDSAKILEIKEKKQMIYTKNKLEKLLKLQSKERRYEIKLKKYEILSIAKAWSVLYTIFWSANNIRRQISERKDLHRRSSKVLVWLMNFCRSIGKFKIILEKIRISKAFKTLKKHLPIFLKWTEKIRTKWAEMTVDICERVLAEEQIAKLMKSFINKVIFIQRTMRSIFIQRKSALIIKRLLWNKVEYKMYIESRIKKRKIPPSELEKRISFEAIKGRSSVPDSVKDFKIMNILKMRMNEYRERLKIYNEECKLLKQEFTKNLYKLEAQAVLNNVKLQGPSLPPRPKPNYVITEAEYRKMIHEAIQKRKEWEAIVKKKRKTQKISSNKKGRG